MKELKIDPKCIFTGQVKWAHHKWVLCIDAQNEMHVWLLIVAPFHAKAQFHEQVKLSRLILLSTRNRLILW